MWLVTPYGFYSAIAHRSKPDTLIVRARARTDLETLIERFELNATIETILKADYPHRIELPKSTWADVVARMAQSIDYANFKDEAKRVSGKRRADVLMRVWSALRDIERDDPTLPKSGWARQESAWRALPPLRPAGAAVSVRGDGTDEPCVECGNRLEDDGWCEDCGDYSPLMRTEPRDEGDYAPIPRLFDDVREPDAWVNDTVWADASTDAPAPPLEDDEARMPIIPPLPPGALR